LRKTADNIGGFMNGRAWLRTVISAAGLRFGPAVQWRVMEPSKHVSVRIDLSRVRHNVTEIARLTGTAVIAVVKADAYGLGAAAVAKAIGDLVEAFYVFDAAEAIDADLLRLTGKRTIALHGESADADDYLAARIHPVVWSVERARLLWRAAPVLAIDTGQQRFSAPAELAEQVARAGDCREAMTHAIHLEQVHRFRAIAESLPATGQPRFLHAAGSALLDEPSAWLDAVRPGLAMYRDAVRVSARLVEARDSSGPAGYSGFVSPRFGVIIAGYRNGLKPGLCAVNGESRHILEVGMQSAFVELGPTDRVGDEVILFGPDGPALQAVSSRWQVSQQEALVRLTGAGIRV
jgi:alanine racemase